ncbi:Colicin I receptor [BD1-7 clade bacterium]|uniref:Colicin I receptor n=1 Tax=BD1-7 clade bacterium TaxID=2029982 RepID=A0A5S9PL08_9GAMM|nr:Colicin I receptor [BD1-7 clade bacterium]CAA0104881.1 Colicin I receptor [BD1-7 clade bacterium]
MQYPELPQFILIKPSARSLSRYAVIPISVVVSIALSIAANANAQENSASPEQTANNPIEEVVVTGHWGEEALKDTPVSASVFNQDQLRHLKATNIRDISGFAPNLQVVPTIGGSVNAAINIRGAVTTTNNLSRDAAVSLYLDGVPIGKTSGAIFDAIDLERVEVLRGPQGTRYGRNTIGGAINLVTRKPDDEFSASVETTAGNQQLAAFRGNVNLPGWQWSDDLTFNSRISVFSRHREGFISNSGPSSQDYDNRNQWGGRIDTALHWQDTFTLAYSLDHVAVRQTPTAIQPISRTGTTGFAEVDAAIDAQTSRQRKHILPNDSSFHSNLSITGHAIRADYQMPDAGLLGDVTLRSISAYRALTTESATDFDGTSLDVFRFILDNDFDQFSQELQWLGETDQVNYVIGAFFYRDDWQTFNPRWQFQFGGDDFDTDDRSAVDDAIAIYSQADWTPDGLDQRWVFSAGLRFTREEKNVTRLRQDVSAYAQNPADPNACVCQRDSNGNPITRSGQPAAGAPASDLIALNEKRSWEELTWQLAMQYTITDSTNAYARISTGFTSGGFNGVAATNQAFETPFDPENVMTYEIGTKSSLMGGLMQLDTAVFYNNFTNLQASVIDPTVLGIIVENAADATTAGVEVEWRTFFGSGINAYINYAYLFTQYGRFDNNGINEANTRTFAYSPKNNVSSGVSYSADLPGGSQFVISTDYRWQGDQWIDSSRSIQIDAYGLWNARAAIQDIALNNTGEHTLDIALWGANLANADYIVTGIDFGFAEYATFGDPVSFGLDITYQYR